MTVQITGLLQAPNLMSLNWVEYNHFICLTKKDSIKTKSLKTLSHTTGPHGNNNLLQALIFISDAYPTSHNPLRIPF